MLTSQNPTASPPIPPIFGDELDRALRAQPAAVREQFIFETRYQDLDGWRYILPPLPDSASVLCVDARIGSTSIAFSGIAATVTVAHPDAAILDIIRLRLARKNCTNVDFVRLDPNLPRLPFDDATFDAFILHDVNALLSPIPANAALPLHRLDSRMLAEIHRILKPTGFAYFGLANRFSYQRLRRSPRATNASPVVDAPFPASVNQNRRTTERSIFPYRRVFPYLIARSVVCEVLPETGYRSIKNSFSRNERIKELLLGRRLSRHLAPAYGYLLSKDPEAVPLVDRLATQLVDANLLPRLQNRPTWAGYYTIYGKVILSLGSPEPTGDRVIAVLPRKPRFATNRRYEITVVAALRALPPSIASRVPKIYTEIDFRGETVFVLSEIPGVTIDRPVPHLAHITANATRLLVDFHRATLAPVVINQELFQAVFGSVLDKIRSRYPEVDTLTARIGARYRTELLGKSIPLVWEHGDYKLENLIVDRRTLNINGVIDWELSRRHGLPLIDLLYLFAYNRMMSVDGDFFRVYLETIQPLTLSPAERDLWTLYLNAIPGISPWQTVLLDFFFFHHIGLRYYYDHHDTVERRHILEALTAIDRRLSVTDYRS